MKEVLESYHFFGDPDTGAEQKDKFAVGSNAPGFGQKNKVRLLYLFLVWYSVIGNSNIILDAGWRCEEEK